MCLLCGEIAFGGHEVSLTERPAQRLGGLYWEGSHAEAAAGAIRAVIEQVKAFSDARATLWKSPIVGLSWNDRSDGVRYFVGIVLDEGEEAPPRLATLDVEEMRFASSWHGEEDGEPAAHYDRMLEWARAQGLSQDISLLHREEYPYDVDVSRPFGWRLLIPTATRD